MCFLSVENSSDWLFLDSEMVMQVSIENQQQVLHRMCGISKKKNTTAPSPCLSLLD